MLRGTDGNIVFVDNEPVLDPRRLHLISQEQVSKLELNPTHTNDNTWWRAVEGRSTREIEDMLVFDPGMLPRLPNQVVVTGNNGAPVNDLNNALTDLPPDDTSDTTANPADKLPRIDADNAFRMSIPVKSSTIVNKVNVSYYELVEDTEPEVITVRRDNCEIRRIGDTDRFEVVVTVRLQKVYDKIENIVAIGFTFIRVREVTANSLTLIFERTGNIFTNINVQINP
ncbi:MAG: hypothetical protein FWC80_07820 [Firmicutes bacterium]|nr:hypothetical protein [Bacillota bacterium]